MIILDESLFLEYNEESECNQVKIASKQVEDSDGFMTDYTWYKINCDGEETHIFMFGDEDIYTPDRDYADAEFDSEEAAQEWFDNYKGFAEDDEDDEDLDESVMSEARDPHLAPYGYEAAKKVLDGTAPRYYYHVKEIEMDPGDGAKLAKYAEKIGKKVVTDPDEDPTYPTYCILDEYHWNDDYFYPYPSHYEPSLDEITTDKDDSELIINGYVIRKSDTSDNYFIYDNNGHVEDDEHKGQGYATKEEAIKRANELPQGIAKEDPMTELARKHSLDILSPMGTEPGSMRVSGTVRDLDNFYKEAEKLGLLKLEESVEMTSQELKDKFGTDDVDLINAGREEEDRVALKEDVEFNLIAEEVGLTSENDLKAFLAEEVQDGESKLEALKRYKEDLIASNLITPTAITEGMMKDLAVDILNAEEAGEDILNILNVELASLLTKEKELNKKLLHLENVAITEIGRGGAFDSEEEVESAIENVNKELSKITEEISKLKAKIKIVSSAK